MTTRKRNTPPPNLEDLEPSDPSDIPGIMPPAGVDATVETKVRYQTRVDPNEQVERQNRVGGYTDELERLAAEESERLAPSDPVELFLHEWQQFNGYFMNVVRLPDPSSRLMPGRTYNRPCREIERLGQTTFEPQNFIDSLQAINGESGGVFRVQLVDPETGNFIPEARLDRIIVGDPAFRQSNPAPTRNPERQQIVYQQPPPPPPEPSRMDKLAEQFMELQMRQMIERLTTPPPPASPESGLTDDQRLSLALLNRTDVVTETINKIASIAQNNPIEKELGWKERALDAAVEIAKNDPRIAQHLADTANNIVTTVVSFFERRRTPATPPPMYVIDPQTGRYIQVEQPPQQAPPQQAYYGGRVENVTPPQQPATAYDSNSAYNANEDEDESDPDTMSIIDQVIAVLNTDDPLTADHPVFQEILRKYPLKARGAFRLIAISEFDDVVNYISELNPLYASLLNGHTGPHLRERLRELQAVIIASQTKGAATNAGN